MKRILSFLVLGELVLCLVVLTIWIWEAYHVNGEISLGLLAYLLGLFVIPAVIIGAFVIYASSLRTKKVRHISPTPHISPEVLDALIKALQRDDNSFVRSKVAVGLSELDLEESAHYYDHNKLDKALIAALNDPDPLVRSKAAEGLTEVELELFTRHKHDQPENARLEDMARTFK